MIRRTGGRGLDGRSERRVYGFVEAVTQPSEANSYARMDIVFDAVDAIGFDDGVALDRAPEHLSIIRIMTTPKRLRERFGVDFDLMEGNWFEIVFTPKRGQPPAWILDATADYRGPVIRTNVVRLRSLEGPSRTGAVPPPLPLQALLAWCRMEGSFGTSARVHVSSQPTRDFPRIRMIDVGHASCAAIHVAHDPDSKIIGYYDVGAPVFFHRGTFPKLFKEQQRVPEDGFVILSHWDFDHYSLALTQLKPLQKLRWYAPDQSVGPNAARFQARLGAHLTFINRRQVPILPGLRLWKGNGIASDRNNSGYVLRATQEDGSALLTGDVGYEAIPSAAKRGLKALGITHHGGSGCTNPPPPNERGRAVVSYGWPNRYKHPNELYLAEHALAGWKIRRTAGDAAYQRGDVWLI